ncbi:alpha/beta hydrolase [Catenuloplanes atrovinosus]|uniref:Dienelactone hydrolase n=1 Tax=Catenuloplanes atrovinosus TaxID=137266 RepID=A0AAE4C9G0_9ACTN|nr:dienelactone hydrolase family protein [Catenuloplanes atrovinosus]MDR7274769.1 dienelactone hydrolase [Catenuloplanes atrovinosus]
MTEPTYLSPFVLPVTPVAPERRDPIDLYLPAGDGPHPAVVLVHGGPIPPEMRPSPRHWPVFQGYGALVASRGAVGAVVDHPLTTPADYPVAAAALADAIETVRADPRVDGERIAVWYFSGGGLLAADLLREPPSWLRCAALSYPLLEPFPGMEVDPAFRPAEAVASAGELPIVLVRAGQEHPFIAGTVATFVTAAQASGADLRIIDVPNGRHSFDIVDDTDESRAAIDAAVTTVLAALAGR